MKTLFIGGTMDGRIEDLPESAWATQRVIPPAGFLDAHYENYLHSRAWQAIAGERNGAIFFHDQMTESEAMATLIRRYPQPLNQR